MRTEQVSVDKLEELRERLVQALCFTNLSERQSDTLNSLMVQLEAFVEGIEDAE